MPAIPARRNEEIEMSKNLYEVTAVKDRYIQTVNGKVKADEGYVAHKSFQRADSEQEAIDAVVSFHLVPGTKYDSIRAELVNEK
jgi:hypothetical protein